MFTHYFEIIDGIELYPIISLIVFFIFFIGVFIWILKADKKYLKTMGNIPLDNQNNNE